MRLMKKAEQARMMHGAMRPVEPGVMQQDGKPNAGPEPDHAVRVDLTVHLSPPLTSSHDGKSANHRKDKD